MGTEIRVRGAADVTDAELHVYADGTSGDDANDGRTAGTPKKTLAAVFDLIPEIIKHNTAVHLSGEFIDFGYWGPGSRIVMDGAYFIIDGGTDVTQVAGPFTATASDPSKLYLDVSGAGWTPDEYAGYWIEITSGSQTGTQLTIQENTIERIQVCKAFTADPGLCDFRIVRPSTALIANTGSISFVLNGWHTDGWVVIQNLFLSSLNASRYAYFGAYYSKGRIGFTSVVTNVIDPAKNSVTCHNMDYAFFLDYYYNPNTFAVTSNIGRGLSARVAGVSVAAANTALIRSGYFSKCLLGSTGIGGPVSATYGIYYGARFKELVLVGNKMNPSALVNDHIVNTSGYSPTKISGSSGVGLTVDKSYLKIGPGVIIADNASHGIELKNHSNLVLNGAVVGTGNAGAGVYAHTHSAVRTKAGSPPTLTGTIGDCSTDGTTEATTWADVEAGNPVSDLNEMTTIEAE